jgi:hypothetical protein
VTAGGHCQPEIAAHPLYQTSAEYRAECGAADAAAVNRGITRNSAAYYDFIEGRLTQIFGKGHGIPETHGKQARHSGGSVAMRPGGTTDGSGRSPGEPASGSRSGMPRKPLAFSPTASPSRRRPCRRAFAMRQGWRPCQDPHIRAHFMPPSWAKTTIEMRGMILLQRPERLHLEAAPSRSRAREPQAGRHIRHRLRVGAGERLGGGHATAAGLLPDVI